MMRSIIAVVPARSFHASALVRRKYYDVLVPTTEASQPISFPSSVQINIHRIPPKAFPPLCPHGRFSYEELTTQKDGLRKFRESSVYYHQMAQETAIAEIRGPLGAGYVPVPEYLDFSVSPSTDPTQRQDIWHGRGAIGGPTDSEIDPVKYSSTVNTAAAKSLDETEERLLHVSCVDPQSELQKRHWGFYRRRIARYISSLTEGFTLPIRMVGVGYRAQLEQVQLTGPSRNDTEAFTSWVNQWTHNIAKSPMRSYIAHQFPDSLWAQMLWMRQLLNHDINRHFRQVESRDESRPMPQAPQKIVLKLGYSHNVEVILPPFIKCSIPNPTKILLSGAHPVQIQELASSIRKWRKPEPYKGKGVFVGDETITLKQKRVK